MLVSVGTDTYGRVKTVGNTAIVTKFFAVGGFPLGAVTSYYLVGKRKFPADKPPLADIRQLGPVEAVPLRRIDAASERMALIRGCLGVLVLVGALFSGFPLMILWLDPKPARPRGEFRTVVVTGAVVTLAVGCLGGLATYARGSAPPREATIRRRCGELLGICIDPAAVTEDSARWIYDFVTQDGQPGADVRLNLLRELVTIRCLLARNRPQTTEEAATDKLLERLDQLDADEGLTATG